MAWRCGLLIVACVCEIVVSFRIHTGDRPEDPAQTFQFDVTKHKYESPAKISSPADAREAGAETPTLTTLEDSSNRSSASDLVSDSDFEVDASSIDPSALPSIQRSDAERPAASSLGGESISRVSLHEALPSALAQVADGVALPEPGRARDDATVEALRKSVAVSSRDAPPPQNPEAERPRRDPLASARSLAVAGSLLQRRVVAWVTSTAAAKVGVGSGQVAGSRWFFGVLLVALVALMFFCAFPCAAACCPNRRQRPLEKPAQRRIRFRDASVRLEGLNDVLREVATPRPLTDPEDKVAASFISFGRAFGSALPPEPLLPEGHQEGVPPKITLDSIAAIVKIAKKLDRTVMKYPKSGRGWFLGSMAQSRYIRVQRHPGDEKEQKERKDKDKEKNPEHEMLLWRQGRLGWWEDAAAYDNKDKPKGTVLLSKIHSVSIGSDKTIVEVQHQEPHSKKILEFVFPSSADAKSWCEAFLDLLAQLHDEVLSDVQFDADCSTSF